MDHGVCLCNIFVLVKSGITSYAKSVWYPSNCLTGSYHISTNDVIACTVDKFTQIQYRFDEYLRANVDQFGRMRPSAPYFSH